jgi:hypothetical protein
MGLATLFVVSKKLPEVEFAPSINKVGDTVTAGSELVIAAASPPVPTGEVRVKAPLTRDPPVTVLGDRVTVFSTPTGAFTVTRAEAESVGLATLAAVTVTAVAVETTAGAVYTPNDETEPTGELSDQITAVLDRPVTVAVKVADCPALKVAEAGVIEIRAPAGTLTVTAGVRGDWLPPASDAATLYEYMERPATVVSTYPGVDVAASSVPLR